VPLHPPTLDRRERPGLGKTAQRKNEAIAALLHDAIEDAGPDLRQHARPPFGWRWPAIVRELHRHQRGPQRANNQGALAAAQKALSGFP